MKSPKKSKQEITIKSGLKVCLSKKQLIRLRDRIDEALNGPKELLKKELPKSSPIVKPFTLGRYYPTPESEDHCSYRIGCNCSICNPQWR